MKLPYRLISVTFFILYILPIAAIGFLVRERIQQRQSALQVFLQNQIDVDRQILTQRGQLREINGRVRSLLLGNASLEERRGFLSETKELQDDLQKFWETYASRYAATQRPFLKEILAETQETRLEEDELRAVRALRLRLDAYFASVRASPLLLSSQAHDVGAMNAYLDGLGDKRNGIYDLLNELADIRFIFSQRIVFFISGENDRQEGFFAAAFLGIAFAVIVITLLEYFFIHRPFGDIMLFLKDMSQGKRGQRLYFSSPIREIKESEEIINQFVGEAEAHEKET